jgi:hypothetical protein
LYPSNTVVADLAHEQRALVGYVHPFDDPPDVEAGISGAAGSAKAALTNALPVDVALGKVDYIEVMGFSEHRTTADVWYRLLNLGYRLPAGAGTDAMANYASLRGPVGLNRVYARVPEAPLNIHPWLTALKQGRTFATNGPLLGFALAGRQLGDELRLPAGENKVRFKAWLRSFGPVDHLEVICNGRIVHDVKLNPDRESADVEDTLSISRSGWCLLRAWSDKAEHPILDAYPYATTSPIYVTVEGSKVRLPDDAAYFVMWIDRLTEAAKSNQEWNTEAEKKAVLDLLARARAVYQQQAVRE